MKHPGMLSLKLIKSSRFYSIMASKNLNTKASKTKLFIDGQFIDSSATQWYEVRNPATQELVSLVPQTTRSELEMAVNSAKNAFESWKKTSILTRQKTMFNLQHLIRENMDAIADNIVCEMGKTKADALGDVLRGLRMKLLTFRGG